MTPRKTRRPSPESTIDVAVFPVLTHPTSRGSPLCVQILTGDRARPSPASTTAQATAPVPQASVSPSTPRS